MKHKISISLAYVFAACAVLAQQEQNIVPAREIVRQSIEHSHHLKIAEQSIQAKEARQSQALAARRPSVSLLASASKYSGLEDTVLGPQITIPGIEERYRWAAEITQPIYTGGRLDAYDHAARLLTESAEASRAAMESDLQLQALRAYWSWAKAVWALDSIEAAVARMKAHTADIRNLKQAGAATDNDVASTETVLAQTELKLGDANRNLAVARARIAHLTGHELPESAMPSKPAQTAADSSKEHELIDTALSGRLERRSAELLSRASALQVKSEKSIYLPNIALVARYEEASPNSQFFPPSDEWKSDMFVGVNLRWNLFESGLGKARVAEAEATAEIAREKAYALDEAISLEVRVASIQLASAVSRCAVAHKAEDSAKRNLESATTLWKNGSARHSELLDAESRFTNAQFDTVASEADAAIAEATLDHALGQRAE